MDNRLTKRAIAAAMSLTMVATATPVLPLYNAIHSAVQTAVMMTANAQEFECSSADNLSAKMKNAKDGDVIKLTQDRTRLLNR